MKSISSRRRCVLPVVPVLIGLSIAAASAADTVELPAALDNTLIETDDPFLSNGAGEHFHVGRTLQPAGISIRRGLIRFDLTSIPPGSTINAATLRLRMSRTQTGPVDVSTHVVLQAWGEGASDADGNEGVGALAAAGDATWAHTFFDTSFWGVLGGDFLTSPSATTSVDGNGFYDWTGAGLADDVQAWVNDPGSNFGWLIMGDETQAGTAKRFDSRQNNNESRRPVLIIDFTPPADVGACCVTDACLLSSEADCLAAAGIYLGDGTTCDDNPCALPEGACCFAGGVCLDLTEAECVNQGGLYQGDGTACAVEGCPEEIGACCFAVGACFDGLTEIDCTSVGGTWQGVGSTCDAAACPVTITRYVEPLPRPAVATPVVGVPGGEATYDLPITRFQQQVHPEIPPTTFYGYGGTFPGPTIEASTGLPVTVNWLNDLRDDQGNLLTEHDLPVDECLHGPNMAGPTARTVTHLHGGHVPMEVDGYPEFTALPGEGDTYVYPNIQDAATIWYHDHALGITRLNVMMGLAGFYLIRDDVENTLNLPTGDFEIPVVIQDRSFHVDGSLSYPEFWEEHFFGQIPVVNGKAWPFLEVKRGKYRIRLLNGSNSRTYRLSLSDGATFFQIGSDGGLLAAPVPLTVLTLSPGERADLVFDFEGYQNGSEILLLNDAPAPFPNGPADSAIPEIMQFMVTGGPAFNDPLPDTLREVTPIPEGDAVADRAFELRKESVDCTGSWWLINGLEWDDITERPVLGTTEIWSFVNRSGISHPMHVHLVFFQVLDRQAFEIQDGEVVPVGDPTPPDPNEAGWKDTVRVDPGEIVRVIARFEDFTGKFAYHCHILEHEDHEMMRQFEVIRPCPADFDQDGLVGASDLAALLAAWGPNPGDPADLDGDDVVGPADLAALLAAWGPCD